MRTYSAQQSQAFYSAKMNVPSEQKRGITYQFIIDKARLCNAQGG